MPDEAHGLDGDRALAGARELSAAGRDLATQRDGPGAGIAAGSAALPWGRDHAGHAFDRRYRPVERQVLDAWEQLAAYMESLGDATARTIRDTMDLLPEQR
jgi:hypothetical protein